MQFLRQPRRTQFHAVWRRRGMTLIELMIVIVILALAAGAVMAGLGAVTNATLRSAALRVVSASRFAHGRATTHGNTVRLHFDFDAHTMAVEEAEGAMVLADQDDRRRGEDDEAIVDPWAAAEARLDETFEPSFGESPFGPIRGRGQVALEKYKADRLGSDVMLARLYASHAQDARTRGTGSVYFFPSGMTHEAVLWLTNEDEDEVYSVIWHPLTGRARIENYAYQPDDFTEEAFSEEGSELRDPG